MALLRFTPSFSPAPILLAACSVLVAVAPLGAATVEAKRSFDLPRGDAATTLRQFAASAGRSLVFVTDKVRGETTNAVRGDFAPREALDRMLAGSALEAAQDAATGALVVSRKRVAEVVPSKGEVRPVSDPQPRPPTKTMKSPRTLFAALSGWLALGTAHSQVTRPIPVADETVSLSPFEVTASDRGYYGTNTMSGTRLNSKIEDLAASITVITKEQMADFAILDINDLFMYEAGTEGTATYTDFSFDRNGYPTDNSSLEPNSANRIRGVSNANIARGNFETSGRVPIDPIDIDAVELSRGPNANIFGLGNAGGTVNLVPASANLTRNTSQIQFRGDSFDGYRSSADFSRVLIKDKLAVRGSGVYQHTGYVRKPSGTDTIRWNGIFKYQPFKSTTLSASYSTFRTFGRMTNLTTPRDTLSAWRNAGSPTWNPATLRLNFNGVPSEQKYSIGTLPPYLINTTGTGKTNSLMLVDGNGATLYWGQPEGTTTASPTGRNQTFFNVNTNSTVEYLMGLPAPGLFNDLSLTDKKIYDWSSINLAAMNYLNESTKTKNVRLDHFFLTTPRQTLALQLGYFEEDSNKHRRDLSGAPTSQRYVGALYVDVNEFLPDGTRNPHLLRPYVGLWNPRSYIAPLDRRTYRAQLAYRLDLRNEKNGLRHLGLHQLSGYAEYKDNISRGLTFDDALVSSHAWIAAGTPRGNSPASITSNYYRFYVGDQVGQNVDYSPHSFAHGNYPYRWGNALAGPITTETATLGPAVLSGGGGSNNHQILKTEGAVLQSYFIKDRIVTTLGLRRDRNYNRAGAPLLFLPDGAGVDMERFHQWAEGDWSYTRGQTKTAGVVVKALPWLSIQANTSDSFQPSTPATNLFLKAVPDPTGKGNDYGFALNLLNGKLVARFTQYETKQLNARDSQATTIASRAIQIDLDSANRTSTPFFLVPLATGWVTKANPTFTRDQVIAAVANIAKIDPVYITQDLGNTGRLAATGDVLAKGQELEVFYNPSNFWTVKFNLTRQETINGQMADDITQFINARLPVWQSIIDPETKQPWFTSLYGTTSAAIFLETFLKAPLKLAQAFRGKSRPEIRKYHANLLANYRLAGLSENRILKNLQVGGAIRWEDKAAIGYYGLQQLPAVITDLDPNRPVYDKARAYFDAFATYRTKLFAGKTRTTFQFNVRNLTEGGRLQPIKANPDGRANAYRIVDPRQFILSATFDL